MMIRFVALCATFAVCCLAAAPAPQAPLAVYYSFDTPPPGTLFAEIQSELGQIVSEAGLQVEWRSIASPRNGTESFPGIAVLRFRGRCFFDGSPAAGTAAYPGGPSLGATDLTEGHMLSFGDVNCDAVRFLIAPGVDRLRLADRNSVLGRALARVSAHEIYHMLTGSKTHASEGIARAAYSRTILTASAFAFDKPEISWLRSWVRKQVSASPLMTAAVTTEAPASPDAVDFAGR